MVRGRMTRDTCAIVPSDYRLCENRRSDRQEMLFILRSSQCRQSQTKGKPMAALKQPPYAYDIVGACAPLRSKARAAFVTGDILHDELHRR